MFLYNIFQIERQDIKFDKIFKNEVELEKSALEKELNTSKVIGEKMPTTIRR